MASCQTSAPLAINSASDALRCQKLGSDTLRQIKSNKIRLIFFASWCASCEDKLQSPDDGKTLAIGIWDDLEKIERVYNYSQSELPCFWQKEGQLAKDMGIKGLPAEVFYPLDKE